MTEGTIFGDPAEMHHRDQRIWGGVGYRIEISDDGFWPLTASKHPVALLMPLFSISTWNFDIDRYLNRFIPAPRLHLVPYPVAHFFGYRRDRQREVGNIAIVFWAAIGIFCSISFIELASRSIPAIERSGLIIVASFGAAAVLEFQTIEAPLAQPRNAVLGQLISATIGVCISKLFELSPDYASIRWLGGGLSCALATAAMALTKTTHPPAGATALLAVVDKTAVQLGWLLIPLMLLGCAIMLGTALLINNIQRRFPLYWWTPDDLSPKKHDAVEGKSDMERGHGSVSTVEDGLSTSGKIIIGKGILVVPPHVHLTPDQRLVLETFWNHL